MLLLIVGLHFVLGAIWLMNKGYPMEGILCFVLGMAATHFGWKKMHARKRTPAADQKDPEQDES